jgi:hypothetical protein
MRAHAGILIAGAVVAWPTLAHGDGNGIVAHADTSLPRFGVMLDAGLPDGATASVVVRPWRPLRISAGGSYNMVSTGYRAGLSLVPFNTWFTPTLSVDYGHYKDGDANPLARKISGDSTFDSTILDRIGYDYVDAHVGLEFGKKWFTFYIHAGATRVTGAVHGLDSATSSSDMTSVSFGKDPTVTLTSVSARVGFIVYFLK